ncbi:MAG: ferredoxin, partial [Caldilineaceae bacterium]
LHADYVISAADGKTTIWNWLGGRYLNDAVTKAYATWKVFPPLVQVMLGVARSFEGESFAQSFPLATPIRVAERGFDRMEVLIYNYDPTLAPAGKTGLQVWYTTNYDWWRQLSSNRPAYEAEKLRIATEVIDALEARWPGLRAQVEVVDVTTPHTFRRYTGNEQGSPDGWCSTVETGFLQLPPALPGLSHFYMAGQWTMPFAGVPGSCMSGRDAIQYICRDEKRAFVTSEPPADWRAPVIPAPVDEGKATLHVPGTATARPLAHVNGNGRQPLSTVRIETASCSGCGDCAYIAPEIFRVDEDGRARLIIEQFGPEVETAVRRAQEGCPEHAIVALEPFTA